MKDCLMCYCKSPNAPHKEAAYGHASMVATKTQINYKVPHALCSTPCPKHSVLTQPNMASSKRPIDLIEDSTLGQEAPAPKTRRQNDEERSPEQEPEAKQDEERSPEQEPEAKQDEERSPEQEPEAKQDEERSPEQEPEAKYDQAGEEEEEDDDEETKPKLDRALACEILRSMVDSSWDDELSLYMPDIEEQFGVFFPYSELVKVLCGDEK
jgi:flagellar biosynthesis GTPase FlhF